MTPDGSRIPYLPERIEGLAPIAMNLSWSWNLDARALFRRIDEPLWHLTRHNPIEMLRRADPARLAGCATDPAYLALYDRVMAAARERAGRASWFSSTFPHVSRQPVAYFCAEFGLHATVPIYSGGLGVLAGDHCKASSDLGVPLVGVGLFYTKGYFDQQLRLDGWQQDGDVRVEPRSTPLERLDGPDGKPYLAVVPTFGRPVHVGAWRIMVGDVPVFLLDTNLEENDPADRDLSGKLYAGGPDLRLRQEWILGVGGVRLLRALGIQPAAWHANEGHAAFMMVERLRELVMGGTALDAAIQEVRARSIFTTHTPVAAGHDNFTKDQIEGCIGPVQETLGLDPEQLLRLGQHPGNQDPRFHMTILALRLSHRVNGVSRRHGEVSRQIWHPLWPNRPVERVPIGHVTNGVHLETWMSSRMLRFMERVLGTDWVERAGTPGFWEAVERLDDREIWAVHVDMKRGLASYVREETRRRWAERWREAAHVVGAGTLLNPDVFTIGFARRFATYKRASLLFHDFHRLHDLLVNPWRPVQIIFAGKAHPEDGPGKEVLQTIYSFTRDPALEGRVAFIEDYDLHLAHRLVQGVDLWLNLPKVPLEACGTSGMKAALNCVPQLSTLDGWWEEGYNGQNGWAIPVASTDGDVDAQDAERLYSLLEDVVVPLFYTRDDRGLPGDWIRYMKHALKAAGERFTARRMVQQYVTDSYVQAIGGEAPGDDPPLA